MVIIKQFSEFANQSANTVNDALETVGEKIVEGTCFVRNKYPSVFRRGGLLTPILDRLCSENGQAIPGSPEDPGFTGGQCVGVPYRIRAEYDYRRQFDPTVYTDGNVTFSNGLPGAITKVDWIIQGGDRFVYDIDHTNGTQNTTGGVEQPNVDTIIEESVRIILERTDGLPDDCGDPGGYPPDPPIDPNDFRTIVTICGAPGDPTDERCVDVAIDFDPQLDENGNQCFTMDGARYCFTPDGIEKEDEVTPTTDPLPPIDDLAPTAEEDATDSEEEDEAIVYVTTEITTFPPQGKTVLQSDSNDNDYFAGYFNWLTSRPDGSYRHPAIPIRKRLQIFTRPTSATGYRAYTVNGAKLRVTVYKETTEG